MTKSTTSVKLFLGDAKNGTIESLGEVPLIEAQFCFHHTQDSDYIDVTMDKDAFYKLVRKVNKND